MVGDDEFALLAVVELFDLLLLLLFILTVRLDHTEPVPVALVEFVVEEVQFVAQDKVRGRLSVVWGPQLDRCRAVSVDRWWRLLLLFGRARAQLEADQKIVRRRQLFHRKLLVVVVVDVEVEVFAFRRRRPNAMIMRPIDVVWVLAGLRVVDERPVVVVVDEFEGER